MALASLVSPADGRIDLNTPQQVAYWTSTFACNQLVLRIAVAAVGARAVDVQRYIQTKESWQKGQPASPTPFPVR
jgi:hypothetical protein